MKMSVHVRSRIALRELNPVARAALACLLFLPLCLAQTAQPEAGGRLMEEFRRTYGSQWVIRLSSDRQRIASAIGMGTRVYQGKPADAARQFLRESSRLFGLPGDLSDLRVLAEKTSPGGGHAEFQQVYAGLPIENARIKVNLDKEGRILQVSSSYTVAKPAREQPVLTRDQAAEAAIAEFLRTTPPTLPSLGEKRPRSFTPLGRSELQLKQAPEIEEIFFVHNSRMVRAFLIFVFAGRPPGAKDFVIDAETGVVLEVRDRVHGDDGSGQVFIPNPNVSLDNDTITRANLPTTNPNPYYTRMLWNLDPPSGGNYTLRGPFVVLEDIDGPANTPPADANGNFVYQRTDATFTDVMIYYHIDRIQRYIQSLGFADVNNRRIRADSHGESGCNAHYWPAPKGAGYLTFGVCKGTLRIAEDAHIIAHEYGHAIQDNQGPGKYDGSGYPRAMGEGFGDYWAVSVYNAEAVASGYDAACWVPWGFDEGHCARWVDTNLTGDDYSNTGDEHDNGQIWSRTLWDIFNSLGKTTADRLIVQSHFNIANPVNGPSFKDGADAIVTADLGLYSGSHVVQLCTVFLNRKIYQASDCPVLPSSTGTQTTLVVLAQFNDAGLQPEPMNFSDVTGKLNQINSYLAEVPYGKASLGAATIKGWLKLGQSRSHYYDKTTGNMLIEMVNDVLNKIHGDDNTFDFQPFDRMIILTNDDGSGGETRGQMEWATTGPWPYELPSLLGTKRLSVSIHRYDHTDAQFTHAMGHHFGLIDLYEHEGVTFPCKYADGWGNMAKDLSGNFNNTHFFAWDKLRPSWLADANLIFIPRPPVPPPPPPPPPNPKPPQFEQTYAIYRQEQNSSNPVVLQVGTTVGVTQRSQERVSYYIEARSKSGAYDGSLPTDGVLVYYVNEDIAQGFGPLRIVNASPATADLTAAALRPAPNVDKLTNIDGTGLTVEVLPKTGAEDYRVHVIYDPPDNRVDVWINPHDENWRSPDIWVDSPVNGFDQGTQEEKDRGEKPKAGKKNRVYARIYNHGPGTAHNVRVDFWFSDPYHAIDGGTVDPDTGSNIAFNKHYFTVIPDLPPTNAGVPVYVEWTPEPLASGQQSVHSCVKVKIAQVFDDTNDFNQASQENIDEYDISSNSPYPPVVNPFRVVNPYDHAILAYLRADNVPVGWTADIVPKKAYLGVGGSIDAQVTIQAPLTYPVCSSEFVKVSAWYPSGDTLVELGATTARVNLKSRTDLTISASYGSCSSKDTTAELRSVVVSEESCRRITVKGCTNPPRPFEHITVEYTGPDGKPVYHDVVTDKYGCYQDFLVNPQGGPWSASASYPGADCSASTQTPERAVEVTDGGIPPAVLRRLWYSMHLGMGFPTGAFGDSYDPGPSLTFDLEYPVTDRLSLVAMGGYHFFHGNAKSGHLSLTNVSVNARWTLPRAGFNIYLQGGPGAYVASPGATKFGFNAGAGFGFPILPKLKFELGPDFHVVDPAGRRLLFTDVKMGVVFRF